MADSVSRVAIAGAGIGGLTLAIALRRLGIDAHVYERAAELRPVGAGLSLMANAMLALRAIGLDETIGAAGEAAQMSVALRSDGVELSRIPIAQVAREVGSLAVLIHRADLHAALLAALGAEHVTLGRAAKGYRDEAGAPAALRFEDGSEVEADLVVGADGLHSAIRKQLTGEALPPEYSGYTSWRGVTDDLCGAAPAQLSESWGRGSRFGIAPVGGGRVYWFAVANAPAGERDAGDPRPMLLERYGSWHPPIRALIEATPPERIVRTDIADRPVLTKWSRGRVALLGDAAHPMTPNLGQGGCQAIEDAVVLSGALAASAKLDDALADYERIRVARANGIVRDSRRLGALAAREGALFRVVRDAMLRWTPASVMHDRFIELFRFQDPFAAERRAHIE